ncbi:MAG: hypothetical protein R3Y05_00130 [bacterium]
MENKLKEFAELYFEGVNEFIGVQGIEVLKFFGKQIDKGFEMPLDLSVLEFLTGQINATFINKLEEYPVVMVIDDESEDDEIIGMTNDMLEIIGLNATFQENINKLNPSEYLIQISKDLLKYDFRIIRFNIEGMIPFGIVKKDNIDKIVELYNSFSDEDGFKACAL